MKSSASFSKDDSEGSKGEIDITSPTSSGWGRSSAGEFFAREIGIENVSLPSLTSKVPRRRASRNNFSKGCPIRMSKVIDIVDMKIKDNLKITMTYKYIMDYPNSL